MSFVSLISNPLILFKIFCLSCISVFIWDKIPSSLLLSFSLLIYSSICLNVILKENVSLFIVNEHCNVPPILSYMLAFTEIYSSFDMISLIYLKINFLNPYILVCIGSNKLIASTKWSSSFSLCDEEDAFVDS